MGTKQLQATSKEEAEENTLRELAEIEKTWDETRKIFVLPCDEGLFDEELVEELDPEEAAPRWIIQPKSGDNADDLKMIYKHNRAILKSLREKGLIVSDDPFWIGEDSEIKGGSQEHNK